ncbi:FecCD family ABC transporter permease [Rhodococcus pyridinivorans]|uniref:FecCD family ABC transporter permease n=1 Tax=Rhodococcus pyridinivorans TaxID=103816 RepID=UPI0039B6C8C0
MSTVTETAPLASPPTGSDARRSDRRRTLGAVLTLLTAALALAIAMAVSLGTITIPLGDVWAIVAYRISPVPLEAVWGDPWWSATREAIVFESRLPRALTAAVVGAALAVAGAVAQAVTRNPLADPYLLGVSSGAGFGVATVTVLGFGAGALGIFTLPFAAFLGALLPLAATIVVSLRAHSVTAIILVGVALSMVFSSLVTFVLLVLGDVHQLGTVMQWLAGGFGDANWASLIAPTLVLLVVGTAVVLCSRQLNLLLTGDDGATALGMNVPRFRVLILLAVSLLAAAAVAVSGTIGFVGLLVPHLAAYLVGRNAARLVPAAALLGAVALVLADILARSLSNTTELPIGVITGLVGGPIFIAMLWRRYSQDRR